MTPATAPYAESLYRWPRGALFCLAVFVVGFVLSSLIPPFQSPDEFDHTKRAYLLTRGQILLDTPAGSSSGGMIDLGLAYYTNPFSEIPFKKDRKLSSDVVTGAESIAWAGEKVFSPAPGTGYNFPIMYLPQAIGLGMGELIGLKVGQSVQLARFLALTTTVLIFFAAFRIARPNPLVYTLLLLPTTLFQMATGTPDGVSTAMAVYAVACFLRISIERERAAPYLFVGLATAVVLTVCCRVHLLPLWLLLPAAWWFTRRKAHLVTSGVAAALIGIWLFVAISTTVDSRVKLGLPVSGIVGYYLTHPLRFVDVLIQTLSDDKIFKFYRESFLGVIGWLDYSFTASDYSHLGWFVVFAAALSVSVGGFRHDWPERTLLLLCAVGATLLVFLALLVGWTTHPATVVNGVQGRYFLVPAFLLAFALGGAAEPGGVSAMRLFRLVGPLFFLYTATLTLHGVLDRYYLSIRQPGLVKVAMKPSSALAKNSPISLHWSAEQQPKALKRLGIQIGTYVRSNPGAAELRLKGPDGRTLSLPIDLPSLVDNQYRMFELDGQPYIGGQIVSVNGGGISAWEAHTESGSVTTCMIYDYTDGSRAYTEGCPRP